MVRRQYGVSVYALASLFIAAGSMFTPACNCDDSNDDGKGGSGAGTSNGSLATDQTGTQSTAALGSSCDPACTAPQFCSSMGHCIDAGTCEGDPDCDMGEVCDTTNHTCVPGGGCGQQEANTTPIPPNLLIVLDRSCSMTEQIGGMTKWEIAVNALNSLMASYSGQIRFGITFFPDTDNDHCGQGAIPVDCAPGNETTITNMLTSSLQSSDALFPDGPCVTNIDTAILQAAGDATLTDPTRQSYVLLLTDGQQSGCNAGGGDAGTISAIAGLLAGTPSVGTFVIGFGGAADPNSLGQFADAGGEINPNGPPDFFDAADQASLETALDLIANKTIGCDFVLDTVPPDPNEIYCFFNNESLPNDPLNGWTYDPTTNTVTFHGTACEDLKDGTVTDVDVVFGCNEPVPN